MGFGWYNWYQINEEVPKLKEVELDIRLLIGPQHAAGNLEVEDDQEDDVHERTSDAAHQDVLRLSSIFPSTVQRLSLLVDDMDEHSEALGSLFSGIALDKSEKLPHLKEVVTCTQSEGYSDLGPSAARSGREAHEASSTSGQDHSVVTYGVHLNTRGTIDGEAQSTSY